MRRLIYMVALGWAVMSGPALAFQETTPAQPAAKPETRVIQVPADPALDFTPVLPPATAAKPILKLQGLGTFGRLPKLDFGLELLYSDEDPAGLAGGPIVEPAERDLLIRGTVRHKF